MKFPAGKTVEVKAKPPADKITTKTSYEVVYRLYPARDVWEPCPYSPVRFATLSAAEGYKCHGEAPHRIVEITETRRVLSERKA